MIIVLLGFSGSVKETENELRTHHSLKNIL